MLSSPIHAADLHATYLRWVWEHGAAGHERGRVRRELAHDGTSTARLVYLDNNVLALNFGAVHRLLRLARIFFSPELDHSGILAERGLGAHRSEGAKRTEEVVKL